MTANTDPALTAARSELARARAEIELLAAWAGGPRQGRGILDSLGMSPKSFGSDDTNAIATVLFEAGDARHGVPPMHPGEIALRTRFALAGVGCFDPRDQRPFVTGGSRWGPNAIDRLLTGCWFDPATMRSCAIALRDLIGGAA
jgi:hypothetical protein